MIVVLNSCDKNEIPFCKQYNYASLLLSTSLDNNSIWEVYIDDVLINTIGGGGCQLTIDLEAGKTICITAIRIVNYDYFDEYNVYCPVNNVYCNIDVAGCNEYWIEIPKDMVPL